MPRMTSAGIWPINPAACRSVSTVQAGRQGEGRVCVCVRAWGGGIGEAFLPRGLETSCWMDGHRQAAPIGHQRAAASIERKHCLTLSFSFFHSWAVPFSLPSFSPLLFRVSLMHVCGCHRDLVLSVTACSTPIIHFGLFGILFSLPLCS